MNKKIALSLSLINLVFIGACKKEAPKKVKPVSSALYLNVTPSENQIHFKSSGILEPLNQTQLGPQVSGRVSWVHPQLGPGLKVKKGQALFKIDPADYQYKVTQAHAQYLKAELEFEKEKYRKSISDEQWEKENLTPQNLVASGEFQYKLAQANLEAANASFSEAKLALSRTVVKAPFDGIIQSTEVSIGNLLGANQQPITISSDTKLKSTVSFSLDELAYMPPLPIDVEITQNLSNGQSKKATGQLIQVSNILNEKSKNLIGTVLFDRHSNDDPLAGSFINIEFKGQKIPNTITIPTNAIQSDHKIWVIKEGKLQIEDFKLISSSADSSLITAKEPMQLVLLLPEGPLPGMPVKGIPHQGKKYEQ